MDDPDEGPVSATALLKTMGVAAPLAALVSACGKSLDKPVLPKPPKPQTAVPSSTAPYSIRSRARRCSISKATMASAAVSSSVPERLALQ